jgi:tetratricopeptide (TPR) repeat protein
MKRILMISLGLALALQATAQADVTSAYNANKQGDFPKAAEYIEKALNDPKAVTKEKTWRYRGDIYLSIAGSPELAANYPNAVSLCMESYFKSMEIDTKKEWIQENTAGLSSLQGLVLERASKQYETNDFCGAMDNFGVARKISTKFGIVDSASIYNGAFCAERCGKQEEALAGYLESAKIGYNVPGVYGSIVEMYNKLGKKDEAVKTLAEARAKYPKAAGLLIQEVNIYLADSNYTKALDVLKALTVEEPKNEVVWLVLGTINEKLGNSKDEEAAYLKALELKPDYYDARYNLGASYYNRGNAQAIECGKISYKEKLKTEECEKACKDLYLKAVEQLEQAYTLSPKNKEVINSLKVAYISSGNTEGQKRMEEALKGL